MLTRYNEIKKTHPGCLLMFRMGDFYEMLGDDARTAHETLGVTLTTRDGVPMAGVPYHSVEGYVTKLVMAGHRPAIIEDQPTTGANNATP